MSIGKLGPFDLDKDNWDLYVDRLEQYFIANDIKEAVKVATLITVIGSDAYELMVNLCTPEKPSTKSFSQLVKVMKTHLQPRPSLLAERFKFRQRSQKRGEKVADYAAELKKMTKDCGFTSSTLKENLRDQFVCGLISDAIRQRLFTEDGIEFDKAYQLAVTMETAETDAAMVEGRTRGGDGIPLASTSVNQLSSARRRELTVGREHRVNKRGGSGPGEAGANGSRSTRESVWRGSASGTSAAASGKRQFTKQVTSAGGAAGRCAACGGQHTTNTCRFRVYVCRICNQQGHLKKVCPNVLNGASPMYMKNR
ncbi:uncharacterized protein LOC126380879 [Pectinophora gossypiella]|uniref:uncharacterized protein LOC126380879 n=1 Tax=Pectinophora gossypiella TaxID=13191 RepID=UPI00214E8A44|nr:uncharacterized protein LOC126380879 [Pectinophora gossypiella]